MTTDKQTGTSVEGMTEAKGFGVEIPFVTHLGVALVAQATTAINLVAFGLRGNFDRVQSWRLPVHRLTRPSMQVTQSPPTQT